MHRLDAGRFAETPGYRVRRPGGTTDFLLVHTRAGRGRFGSPDGSVVPAVSGRIVLLRPGTPHDYRIDQAAASWEIAYCHFHPRSDWLDLLDWPQVAPGIGALDVAGAPADRIGEALLTAGYFHRSDQPRSQLFAINALEQALLWCDSQNPLARRTDERLVAVLEHIDAHLDRPLTVAGLARVAGLSPSRFAHLFREQLQASPMAYVERQRIALAKDLLRETARPVGAIARDVGFEDALYFSSRFRRIAGDSPSGYRRSSGR